MPATPYPVAPAKRSLTYIAWGVTLLISSLPDIVFSMLAGGSLPPALTYAKIGLLLILTLAAIFFKPLRPLLRFFILMAVFFILMSLRSLIDFTIPALQNLFGHTVFDVRMQAEQTGKLVVALLMIGVMLALGFKRRDFFLTLGELRTPIQPVKWLGFPKPDPWPNFGLQWGFYIAAALAVVQFIGMQPAGDLLLKVLPILPAILFYAALNAFNEEITFRSPMLAALEPVGGSRQALWMAAYFFGIGHYFGTPGGLLGGLLSIFMGWILGKAMLETRGFFWAWWIHFLSDVAIFFFLSAALIK